MPENKSNSTIVWSVVVLVVAVATFGFFKYIKKDTVATEIPVATPVAPTATPSSVSSSVYKNGSYSAVGEYMSPGGLEQIGVQLSLSGDVITDVSVQNMAQRSESNRYQNRFISGYKTLVVGKKIDQVSLSRVSGSSLTSKGFNDALAKIMVQAKA